MELQKLGIPASVPAWRQNEIARTRAKLKTDTYEKDGALFWSSVDRPVPVDVFRDAFVAAPAGQVKARDEYTVAVVEEYRTRRAQTGYSAEELAEIRANFEPGDNVVDVFTGHRIRV